MSTELYPANYAGTQETFTTVITDGEAALYAGLVGDRSPFAGNTVLPESSGGIKTRAQHILMVGIVGGFLHTRIAGPGSQCINLQFEFLAPIYTGDRIETIIALNHRDADKQLATYKVDCYNQDRDQVITGQAVMLVSP